MSKTRGMLELISVDEPGGAPIAIISATADGTTRRLVIPLEEVDGSWRIADVDPQLGY